jgi:hypothetical protein
MKRYILPILLLVTVWYIALRSKQKADVEETVSEPAPAAKHSVRPPARVPPAPAPAKTAAPQVAQVVPTEAAPKSEDPHKPPKGMMSFVLYKDLVVTSGDVLIGHPTTPRFPESGYIPIPKTNEWKTREIAFSVHQDLPNPERVLKVIQYFNDNTPVKFVPLKDQTDSIVFAPSDIPLCLSYVGKIGGHQPIYLDDRCGEREIMHEVMHALGYIHEHSRPDRDQYVRVNWGNIELDKQSQFEVMPDELSQTTKGRPFDYTSVMIYGDTDFARIRGDVTLESLDRDHRVAPVQEGLSPEDLERLRIKYGQ